MSSFTYKSNDRVVTIGNDKFIVDMSNISFTNQKVSKVKSNLNYPRLKYPGYFEVEPIFCSTNYSNGNSVDIVGVRISDPLNIFNYVKSVKDIQLRNVKLRVTKNGSTKIYNLGDYFVSDKFPITKAKEYSILRGMRTESANIGLDTPAVVDFIGTISYIANNVTMKYQVVIPNVNYKEVKGILR